MQHQPLIKNRFTVIVNLCFCGLLITLQAGCTQTAESATEGDHLEHHIPEHKPKTYTATVRELNSRMRTLLNDSQAEISLEKKQQLAEIIDWVPELAADSELNHSDWNEVKRYSTELKTLFLQMNFSEIDSALVGRYFLLVKKLDEFSARSEPKKFTH